jgi:hypothetical protein
MSAPSYLTAYILLSMIGIIAAFLAGLHVTASRAGWDAGQRARALLTADVLVPLWFAVALALSLWGAFQGAASRPPTIEFGIFVPVLIGVIWLWRSQTARRLIDALPQSFLVGLQTYRALGLIFLLLYAQGRLPGLFAWPAGAGDVAVGLLAPFVAMAHARGDAGSETRLRNWNILGLVDLTIAITMGFLTSPSPLELFSFDAPNQLISAYPLVMIPVFAVPLSILLHAASLIKLSREAARRLTPAIV